MCIQNYPELPSGVEAEYCGHCGVLMKFEKMTRLGYADHKCDPCRMRKSTYTGLAVARKWLKENQ